MFQGKIFVEEIAQKTNAYQLSKGLLLDKDSEFSTKPELEIYADDVKCSHGSTSGNIDKDALFYLKARGITGAVAKKFNLGYAPNSWDTIFKQSHKKYNHQDIEESGLFIEKEKGFYDRFRDRIIFPIRNIKGQFIGLGGRIIEAGEPKYLNSPETKLFNKSNELFGLFEAKDSKNTDTLIVVEGYMDVIGLYQHGIPVSYTHLRSPRDS